MEYYIRRRNGLMGPFDLETLKEKIRSNQFQNFDEIGESRKGPWKSLALWVAPLVPPHQPELFTMAPIVAPAAKPPANTDYSLAGIGNAATGVQWFYRYAEEEPGPPVSEKEIRSMIKRGDLDKDFFVWSSDMEEWEPITDKFGSDFRIKKNKEKIKEKEYEDDGPIRNKKNKERIKEKEYEDDGPKTKGSRKRFSCPFCDYGGPPVIKNTMSTGGWVFFITLLLFCFPLCFLPFIMGGCKDEVRKCGSCGSRFG
ncbi:MAG: DUF4339 domain-containing protein [Gemmataceae bacterium]|nr:DUF4339 domain-containing protein [Gemmataceae bacterium]